MFFEFLVEKNHITKEQLLEAMAEQELSTPGLLGIAVKESLLDAERLYEILRVQKQNNEGFIESARKLGFWNEDLSKQFEQAFQKNRKALVSILVEKGYMDIAASTSVLEAFLQEQSNEVKEEPKVEVKAEPVPAPEPKPTPEPSPVVEEKVEASSTPTSSEDYEPHLYQVDSTLIESFQEIMPKDKIVESLQFSESDFDEEKLKTLFEEVHTLKGVACFVRVDVTTRLADDLEQFICYFRNHFAEINPEKRTRFVELVSESVKVIEELYDSIVSTSSEQKFWDESGSRFQKLRQDMMQETK